MHARRSLPALLAASLAIGAVAMAPALTTDETTARDVVLQGAGADQDICTGFEDAPFCAGDSDQGGTGEDPEVGSGLYETCDPVDGATTITPEDGFDDTVPTPVGAANQMPTEDAGLYQLDLSGLEVGTTARVRMVLSWDTPGLGDYDLIINGANEGSVDDPETHTRTLAHCDLLDLETVVFIGLPVDTLNLQVRAATTIAPQG